MTKNPHLLVFLIYSFVAGPLFAFSLTPDEEREYLRTMNSPEIQEIRHYLDACLSGAIFEPEDQYPCNLDGPPEGGSIREHPRGHIDQRFGVIIVEPFAFNGSMFTILFAESPHLAINVWVYPENGVSPDVRSFQVTDLTAEQRVEIADKFRDYLTDDRFTR